MGKSELLRHFGEGCRQFYFEASSGSQRDQLDDLGAELARFNGRAIYAEQPLGSWRAAFAAATRQVRSRTYETDAVAVDAEGRVMALGSCQWPEADNDKHEHDAGELDKLETIREKLDAPDAALYFFDRVGFSPRLQDLASERDDVHLVLASELA